MHEAARADGPLDEEEQNFKPSIISAAEAVELTVSRDAWSECVP